MTRYTLKYIILRFFNDLNLRTLMLKFNLTEPFNFSYVQSLFI